MEECRSNPDRPMDPSDDRDLVAELQCQVVSLRARVEELEQENARLASLVSSCRCSKEEVSTSHANEVVGPANSFSSDHQVTSCGSPAKDEVGAANGLYAENSRICTDQELIDKPGCSLRTTHHCARRYVALKIMYFGQRFYGFASEAQMDPTIESEIFKALRRTKLLVGEKGDSQYSRCGRTDKGVSSTGQVIALYLRSNLNNTKERFENEDTIREKYEKEIDYVRVLNRVLPRDIRVMGWCPVPAHFHARFSCLSREYKYFFWRGTLDILAMQRTAKRFIGKHDFRNFCKMDAANVSNYKREITIFDISPCNRRNENDELWAITIKGSAFLWHQVRCLVAVLFMIGQGLESPDVVDVMLDTDKTPRKPQYNMAHELPLVLRFCEFKDLKFICSSDARKALHEHLKNEFQTYMLQAAVYDEALDDLPMQGLIKFPEGGSLERVKKKKAHISLMQRPTEPSYEERRTKLNMKATDRKFTESCTNTRTNHLQVV